MDPFCYAANKPRLEFYPMQNSYPHFRRFCAVNSPGSALEVLPFTRRPLTAAQAQAFAGPPRPFGAPAQLVRGSEHFGKLESVAVNLNGRA